MKSLVTILFFLSAFTASAQVDAVQMDKEYTSGLFKNDNAHVIVPENDPSSLSAFSLFSYLQGKVAGVRVLNANTFSPSIFYRNGKPDLYLNEFRVDAKTLASISMSDIAMIKVFRPPFMGSHGGGMNGAIAVYTWRGEEEEEEEE